MKTVEVKISELEGAALDWAVAGLVHAEKWRHDKYEGGLRASMHGYRPSADWSQGGPLIERFIVDVTPITSRFGALWAADCLARPHDEIGLSPTPLIASMRAIVAAHADGDTVEVPAELVEDVKQDGDEQWKAGES